MTFDVPMAGVPLTSKSNPVVVQLVAYKFAPIRETPPAEPAVSIGIGAYVFVVA